MLMNPQVLELIGRNYLVSELLKANFEVAQPLRDRGIDLIAYIDIDEDAGQFIGIPIQMKAASKRSFSIAKKYNKFPDLILTYVWDVISDHPPIIYALTQREAVSIGDDMGYTQTPSWIDGGLYTTNNPSKKLVAFLEPYRMTPERWRDRLLNR